MTKIVEIVPTPNEEPKDTLVDNVVAFVKKQGHASCFEIMKEFKVKYGRAVYLMDELEAKEIVQPFLLDDNDHQIVEPGPRKLMTPEFKKHMAQHEKQRQVRIAAKQKQQEEARIAAAEAAARAAVVVQPEKKKKRSKK